MKTSLLAESDEKASGELKVKVVGKNLPGSHSMNVEVDPDVCGKTHSLENTKVSPEGYLQNAVVWLESPSLKTIAPVGADQALVIDNCDLSPRVVLLSPQSLLEISSKDSILFQIRSKGQKNPKQVRPLPPNLQKVSFRFREPEIVPISCDLHPWMKAFIVVMSHPFYRITNTVGDAKFPKVPYGEYDLYLWHEIFGQKKWANKVSIKSKSTGLKIDWDFLETQMTE